MSPHRDAARALHVPTAPTWAVAWEALDRAFPWIAALRGCPQDPRFHAEGDVWIHTRMVCEAMAALPAFREASEDRRIRLFAAALLHDVAKPRCTMEQDGQIRSPGHSPAGSFDARQVLWRLGLPFADREQICALVRYHQVPYHWASRDDSLRLLIRMSQTAALQELGLLARADMQGRRCEDQQDRLDDVELFGEYAREHGCLDQPWAFANEHARVMYFRRPDRDPSWVAHDDTRFTVTVMSGLPGSGKSTWVQEHGGGLPVIELDAIRRELGIDPAGPQGKVIDVARARAREHLRGGEPFVWDATNLGRSLRARVVNLALDYGARVRMVYAEAAAGALERRNRERAHPVPDRVLGRMLRRWEPPDRTEAHELVLVGVSAA